MTKEGTIVVRAYAVGCTDSTSYMGFPCACVLGHCRVQEDLICTYFDKGCAYPATRLYGCHEPARGFYVFRWENRKKGYAHNYEGPATKSGLRNPLIENSFMGLSRGADQCGFN